MNIKNLVLTLEKEYPNGRFIHAIRERGLTIQMYINNYFETNNITNLYIAQEHFKTLNKILDSNLSLYDIDELTDLPILKKIVDAWKPFQ